MNGKRKRQKFYTVSINLFRLITAFVFVFSGFVKASDPVGTSIKFHDYLVAFGAEGFFSTNQSLIMLACALAVVEFIIGVYLFLGIYKSGTTLSLLVIMAVFSPFTLYVALTDPVSDCGCFGDVVTLTNWQTFTKNVILLAMALLMFINKRRILPFVTSLTDGLVSWVTMILIVTYSIYNVNHLPLLDFRPYKEGTNLKTNVIDRPAQDYVNFWLSDSNGQDCTKDFLERPGYTVMLVSPYLEEFDYTNFDLLSDLVEYAKYFEYRFVVVTSSGTRMVEQWSQEVDPYVEFLFSDDVELKTMIRSNPGLVILHNGRIMSKFSSSDIPDDKVLVAPLEQTNLLHADRESPFPVWLILLLCMMVPFMVIALINIGIVVYRRYVK
ncbi:MAG: hypothetical protein MJY74_07220 [Bacteroidaceae bacterium]|nr:hypothetical protein [Bacteroidaceae bacterium]